MKPEVRAQFPEFTARFEGRIPWLYVDVKGLVTVGLGCLCDPVGMATSLPFVTAAGEQASTSEIRAEWGVVKYTPGLPEKGAGAAKLLCRLRLPETAIDELARHRLDANERILTGHFPEWEQWPAPAQLAVLSMAWAMGAGFPKKWPAFAAACRAQQWLVAAENCKIREAGNPGIVPRNKKNAELFRAAATPAPKPASGITQDDRDAVERLQKLWFYEQTGEPEQQDQS